MILKGHNALRNANRAVLWLNGKSLGVCDGINGEGGGDFL